MTPEQVIAELDRGEAELACIHSSFKRTRDGMYLAEDDEALDRQYARESMPRVFSSYRRERPAGYAGRLAAAGVAIAAAVGDGLYSPL